MIMMAVCGVVHAGKCKLSRWWSSCCDAVFCLRSCFLLLKPLPAALALHASSIQQQLQQLQQQVEQLQNLQVRWRAGALPLRGLKASSKHSTVHAGHVCPEGGEGGGWPCMAWVIWVRQHQNREP